MADNLGLLVEFKARYDGVKEAFRTFGAGMQKIQQQAKTTENAFEGMSAKASKSFDKIAKSTSVADTAFKQLRSSILAVASVGTFMKIMGDVDKMGASAAKFDMPVEQFQQFEYAAKRADTEIGTMEMGLQKLRSTLSDAANGSKTAQQAFTNLGLDPKTLEKMSSGDAYKEIAKSMKGLSSLQQVSAANGIFGTKGGQEQLNLLRSMMDSMKEYKALALGLTADQMKAHEALDKQFDQASAIAVNKLKQAYIGLAPAVGVATSAMADWMKTGFGIGTIAGEMEKVILKARAKLLSLAPESRYDTRSTIGAEYVSPEDRRNNVTRLTSAQTAGNASDISNSLKAAFDALVPAVVTAREAFVSTTAMLDKMASVSGNLVAKHSNLNESMGRLTATTGAVSSALTTLYNNLGLSSALKGAGSGIKQGMQDNEDRADAKKGIKSAFGLDADASSYLNNILKPLKQIEDVDFTRQANEIRDMLNRDDSQINWERISNEIDHLKTIASPYTMNNSPLVRSGETASGMDAVIRELQQAKNTINKPQQVDVNINVTADEGLIAKVASSGQMGAAVKQMIAQTFNSAAGGFAQQGALSSAKNAI